jgi:hypothetical protein
MLINDKPNPSKLLGAAAMSAVNVASGAGKSAVPKAFAQALSQVRQSAGGRADPVVKVKSGDTLIGLIKNQAAAQGVIVKPGQEMRLAQQVAQDNRIQNPNWIFPGQQISFNSLNLEGQTRPTAMVSSMAPAVPANVVVASVAQVPLNEKTNHPVLEKRWSVQFPRDSFPRWKKMLFMTRYCNSQIPIISSPMTLPA